MSLSGYIKLYGYQAENHLVCFSLRLLATADGSYMWSFESIRTKQSGLQESNRRPTYGQGELGRERTDQRWEGMGETVGLAGEGGGGGTEQPSGDGAEVELRGVHRTVRTSGT